MICRGGIHSRRKSTDPPDCPKRKEAFPREGGHTMNNELLNRIRKKQNRMATQAASAVRKILKRFSICTAERYSGLPFFLFMDHTSNNCVVLFLDAQHIFAQDLRGNAGQILKIGPDLALVKDDDAVADVD